MKEKFERILKHLVGSVGDRAPLTGVDIAEQFSPEETGPEATLRNLNAAFLIALCGSTHPLYTRAMELMRRKRKEPPWAGAAQFYLTGLLLVKRELSEKYEEDEGLRKAVDGLDTWLEGSRNHANPLEDLERTWKVFFPEGVFLFQGKGVAEKRLRSKRGVHITRLNPHPIMNPAKEILFTSNVLLTLPTASMDLNRLDIPAHLKGRLREIQEEAQLFWYDHPMYVGVEKGKNEAFYGLVGLDRAIAFEKRRGTMNGEARLQVVLSVSVTHKGLQGLAKAYLEDLFTRVRGFEHLRIFVFTETDTDKICSEVLAPAARHYLELNDVSQLREAFGVNGEYGRHYSFLKAVSALWQVFWDRGFRATFKIDLDQVFPQRELVKEAGGSAFEHFRTPLWGATGLDEKNEAVELGMIAGALVNREDIGISLFTPDVDFPNRNISGGEWIFFSPLPQALSTRAEMMCRYMEEGLDGREKCIQRVHVTGGTCGILIDSLRRHRPFTPGFIGRAEDQAYLLSILFGSSDGNLRYVHKDGLIMRHDKGALARESMEMARTGKLIGDYARILLFSYYIKALPWSIKRTKDVLDPFTGCFVSPIPLTVVYLRMALEGASFFLDERAREGFKFLRMGTSRLQGLINTLTRGKNPLKKRYEDEKQAWNIFYDILDHVERGLEEGEAFAVSVKKKVRKIIRDVEIKA